MANTKSGVVLAVGQPQQIQSKEGKVFSKRSLYVDCTTFDPYTGQRSQYENKILFDFMESKTSLLDNIQVGQVVTVYFDLQGTELTEQDGRKKFYTHVRPYKIDVRQVQPSNRQPQQPTYQPPQVEDDRPF
ncbi:DUF3127 domain-containing protein [Prevotella pallens]|uniref:DUF3127 domain-containing protein n=1 Tax=Prevotella pallens TaxID=60133 RepID=UPI0028E76F81|nr:DUF3127 domain-containing protein [Prevotella pallens]